MNKFDQPDTYKMKRELKFRVWDNEKKIMFSHDWLYSACVQYGALVNNPRTAITTMQFTGLKDKNGKEVYEGDVIQAIGSEGTRIRHEIIFDDCSFCSKNLTYGNIGKLTQKWLTDLDFEVIGNIFANPELLTI